jgi:CubicO group peptidase (beta-lactamase class C family)
MSKLPRSRPEAEGVDPAGILAFIDAVDKNVAGMHSMMLLRHGKVVAEGWWRPYGPEHPHMLWSLSKSFTSTAVGLAIQEKRLTLDDTVLSFFPGDLPKNVSKNLAAMRVRHLLTMATGHAVDTVGTIQSEPNGNWVAGFLAQPVDLVPGSKFVYNSGATYMLSAIVQKVSGKTTLDYLRPQLFDPLGIQNPTWETCPKGISTGGWGLAITTEDIARLGQLYLQKGRWNGRMVLPKKWVEEATRLQIATGDSAFPSDWTQGYCYQFWRCRHDGFRADGAFGQFSIVLPEQDAVLALTCGTGNTQGVLNAVWDHLLPSLRAEKLPLQGSTRTLDERLKHLEIPHPKSQVNTGNTPVAKQVIGKVYRFAPNDQKLQSVTLTPTHVLLVTDKGEQKLAYGSSRWTMGVASLGTYISKHVATRGAWTTPDTLVVTACAYETTFIHTLTFTFTPADLAQVAVTHSLNVNFGPTQFPRLTGRLS